MKSFYRTVFYVLFVSFLSLTKFALSQNNENVPSTNDLVEVIGINDQNNFTAVNQVNEKDIIEDVDQDGTSETKLNLLEKLTYLLTKYGKEVSEPAYAVITALSKLENKIDTYAATKLKQPKQLSVILKDLYNVLQYQKPPAGSILENKNIVDTIFYIGLVANSSLYPPDAFASTCLTQYSYIGVINKDFEENAKAALENYLKETQIINETAAQLLPEEFKINVFEVILNLVEKIKKSLIADEKDPAQTTLHNKQIAQTHNVQIATVERFSVYTAVLFSILPDAIQGQINPQTFGETICSGGAYDTYMDYVAGDVKQGSHYWEYIQQLMSVSGFSFFVDTKNTLIFGAALIGATFLL